MYRHCICIGVLILLSLPLWSQQDTGDSVPSPGEAFQDCDECPKMVVVPSGSFTMGGRARERGDANERPLHRVRIDYRFAVGVYEVTFDEWYACVDGGGCGSYIPDIPSSSWDRENRPVINVSWDDAQSYVRWLSARTGKTYRLLSEAEWEYVARAGTGTAYSWGDSIGVNRANCDGCGSQWDDEKTAPVGSFAANAWGVHDMHGNVYEWVEDCWNDSYVGAPAAWWFVVLGTEELAFGVSRRERHRIPEHPQPLRFSACPVFLAQRRDIMQRIIRSIFVLFLLGFFTVASAQLPPKIMADKHLLHAEQLYDAKNYAEAFSVMGKIIALQQEHSLTLSDEFHFKHARIALSVDSTRIASGTSAIDHPLNGQSCVIRQRANGSSPKSSVK